MSIGTAQPVYLKEDKKKMVEENRGWEGKRYFVEPDGAAGTYEAHVYSNVEPPKEGRKFASTAAVTETGDYEYQLNTTEVSGSNTELTISTDNTAVQERIASASFDQSAGKKEFKLPANTVRVVIAGSYHGVSGS